MDQPLSALQADPGARLSDRAFWGLGAALAFVAYLAALLASGTNGLLEALAGALRNLVVLLVVSLPARAAVTRHLIGRGIAVQLAGHVLFAAVYSILFYWLLMVLIGVANGDSFIQFVVKAFFPGPAIAWQFLQGATLYALVAALAYLRAPPPVSVFVMAEPAQAAATREQGPSRYFIRKGEDIHPIEVSKIVSITGADDYAEVATLQERHLVKMTLAEFEKTLEGDNFIRVHRSHIVNFDRIERAEPAGGGRMLLHMEDGQIIPASRAGSKLLRDRII